MKVNEDKQPMTPAGNNPLPTDSSALQPHRDGEARPLRFGKAEKLRHRTLVEGLFTNGRGLFDYPLRMMWRRLTPEELAASFRNGRPAGIAPVQMMVTVPKKKRRHAVDRVLMRRRIREAYRLNRLPLLEIVSEIPGGAYLQLAFVYLHNENVPYADVERKMKKLLAKLQKQLCASEPSSDTPR